MIDCTKRSQIEFMLGAWTAVLTTVTPGFLKDAAKLHGELGVAVEDQEPLVAQEALTGVGEVSRDLCHECCIGVRGHTRDLDESARVMDHEQDVVRHEPACGPNIDGKEVGSRNHTGVRLEEGAPRSRTLRARGNSAVLQRLAYRGLRDVVPELLHLALDAAVAPAGIVLGHADDQFADRLHEPWPADAVSLVGVLRRDQLSVPAQDGVGSDDRGNLGEQVASECVALGGESAPLILREPWPMAAELFLRKRPNARMLVIALLAYSLTTLVVVTVAFATAGLR